MAHHNTYKGKPMPQPELPKTAKNMAWLIILVILSVIAGSLTSCKTTKKTTIIDTFRHDTCYVKVRQVDTFIKREADTASARLLLECDENGKALVQMIDNLQGQFAHLSPTIEYVYRTDTNGMVRRDAYIALTAIADGFAERVSILESELGKGNTEYNNLKSEYKKETSATWKWAVGSFVLGVILTLCAFIKITK